MATQIIRNTTDRVIRDSGEAAVSAIRLPFWMGRGGMGGLMAGIRLVDGVILPFGLDALAVTLAARRGPNGVGILSPIPPVARRFDDTPFTPNLNSTFCQSCGRDAPRH